MNDFKFEIPDKKILNIKIYEEDFNLIRIAILTAIQNIQKNIEDPSFNLEAQHHFEKSVLDYNKLLSKLEICKLYNENDD